MAKAPKPLTRIDIILNAEADVIKEAYESRLKIDQLLTAREDAYRQIAEIEQQIEETVGEEGLFLYPEPPLPIAGSAKGPSTRKQPEAKAAKLGSAGAKTLPKMKKSSGAETPTPQSQQVSVES